MIIIVLRGKDLSGVFTSRAVSYKEMNARNCRRQSPVRRKLARFPPGFVLCHVRSNKIFVNEVRLRKTNSWFLVWFCFLFVFVIVVVIVVGGGGDGFCCFVFCFVVLEPY